ncbi:MAG: hypothetical protein ABID83_04675 [Candidatus Omnitrophota bacterium]
MISKKLFEDILYKYPELIDAGLVPRGRHVNLYDQMVDILFVDRFKKKLVVQVRTSPIEKEHIGEIVSYQKAVLSGEAPDVSFMLVADKVPPHLKTAFEHKGVAWKEITVFQIREHLTKRNDTEMLELLS